MADKTNNEEGKAAEEVKSREDEVIDLGRDPEAGDYLSVGELTDALTGEIDESWPVYVSRDGQIAPILKVIDKTGQADEHKRQVWIAIGPWKPAP